MRAPLAYGRKAQGPSAWSVFAQAQRRANALAILGMMLALGVVLALLGLRSCQTPDNPPAAVSRAIPLPAPGPEVVTLPARTLGTFRVTWYGKGRNRDGSRFTGRYNTAAARPWVRKGTLLLVQAPSRQRVLMQVNDNFGDVWVGKGKARRKLPRDEVEALVAQGVLSAVDLSARAAKDLGIQDQGHALCWVREVRP